LHGQNPGNASLVSIHAPARGATIPTSRCDDSAMFQFTRPRGARPHGASWWWESMRCFNSRARAGRDLASLSRIRASHSFNSRARAGRDSAWALPCWIKSVSIHAPARGATKKLHDCRQIRLFQFTRPRGARPRPAPSSWPTSGFNSRARAGRDSSSAASALRHASFQFTRPRGARPDDAAVAEDEAVSIHAPARGATFPPKGLAGCWGGAFQFTRPRGARPNRGDRNHGRRRFNSRARAGRDHPPGRL